LFVAFGVAMPFRYLGFVFGVALTSAGLQGLRTRVLAVAVVGSLVLNVVLIPVIGITGALVAVVAGWVITSVLVVPDVERVFGRVLSARDLVRFVTVALAAFLVGLAVRAVVGGPLGDPVGGLVFAGLGVLGFLGLARLDRRAALARP